LPDTTCWETYLPLKDSIDTDLYESLRYPGYRYFPVVGITYEQAANYSRWRGDIVTAGMKEKTEKDYPALGQFEVSVVFRLPTKEEWEFAAAGGLNLQTAPYGLQRPWKGKRRFESGLKRPAPECLDRNNMPQSRKSPARRMEFNVLEDFYFDDGNIISCHNGKPQDIGYIYDYPPNPYSLYNMIGNVAELTSTKGVAKGGSFEHKLSDCAIEKDFPYDGPHEWLGFRCIAEVHFKKR
jgi:formylglycine-generating enzyme required for sulfatase activity